MSPAPKSKKSRTKAPKNRPQSTSALSQPVVEDASSTFSLSSFSPKGDLFAYVSLSIDKHRLRVYDTVTGQSISEHVVDSARITALAWTQFDPSEGQKSAAVDGDASPKKKRKKRNSLGAQSEAAERLDVPQVVVLGLSDGSLLLFSPSHARVLRTLSHPSSTAAILSLDFSTSGDNATTIYASSADGSIRLWDARNSSYLASWKGSDRIPCTSISVRRSPEAEDDEHVYILAAHTSIKLLSADVPSSSSTSLDPDELATFTGHASNITSLHWQPTQSEGEPSRHFVSMAERDRHVCLWEVPDAGSKEGKLSASIPLDSDARQISVSPAEQHNLLVLSASGRISVFSPSSDLAASVSSKKSKSKISSLEPRSTVTVSAKRTPGAIKVVAATFVHDQEGHIRIARIVGGVRPVFDIVQYLDDSGDFIPDVNVVSDVAADMLEADQGTQGPATKRYAESTRLAVRSSTALGQDAADDITMADASGALDVDLAELSLGQRLTALDPGAHPGAPTDSDADEREREREPRAAPSSITLTRTLIQALHSADTRLLETCLNHTEPGLVTETVRRLPPQLAVPLLNACVERLGRGKRAGTGKGGGGGAGSQRAGGLVRWVKTVLVVHSGHLMTMPDLVARLSGLHATLTSRMALQESLLGLSGRLDMVLQQIELRSSAAPAPVAQPAKAKKGKAAGGREARVYIEGESEEEGEDGMDVEVEVGSEVGSIEDVELGGESDEDEDEDDLEEGDFEDEDDSEDDEGDEDGPMLNGFIDDEAEESEDEGSEEETD